MIVSKESILEYFGDELSHREWVNLPVMIKRLNQIIDNWDNDDFLSYMSRHSKVGGVCSYVDCSIALTHYTSKTFDQTYIRNDGNKSLAYPIGGALEYSHLFRIKWQNPKRLAYAKHMLVIVTLMDEIYGKFSQKLD